MKKIDSYSELVPTLDEIRTQVIYISFSSISFICFILLIFRIIEHNLSAVLATAIALISNLIIVYACRKNYQQTALMFISGIYLIISFSRGYQLNMPLQTIIYFSLIPAIIAFMMKYKMARITYLLINNFAFTILLIKFLPGTLVDVFTILIVTAVTHTITLFVVNIMERQQDKLFVALDEKRNALDALALKHHDILLFTDIMNHDIKAPLNTVKGFIGLLRKEKQSERSGTYINYITKSLSNLDTMIADLLTLSKVNTTELSISKIDLNDIVDQICNTLEFSIQKENVHIEVGNLPIINGNSEALRTVFQNIISNSIKYQPKDEPKHIPSIYIYHEDSEKANIIFIKDNGIGIKEEDIPQLFSPFKRFHSSKDYEGTGLGMSICKKTMKKHKGDISYVLTDEGGACFRLEFPKTY